MRLAGVDIPGNKHVSVGLTYIYGIGPKLALDICQAVGLDLVSRVKDLTSDEVNRTTTFISENFIVEGDLRKRVSMDIKLLIEIGCYKGRRHYNKLPVHGQRTRTNAKTRKGKSSHSIPNKKKLK